MAPHTQKQASNPAVEAIEEEAIAWFVRLSAGHAGDEDRSQHMDWLLADPRHIQAYEAVCERLQATDAAEPVARTAFSFHFGDSHAGMFSGLRALLKTGLFWPRLAMVITLVAAALFFAFSSRLPLYHAADIARHYAAPAHEMVTVRLADSSKVTLGPGTAIDVVMTEGRRTVRMGVGRAFFDVHHDAARPFYVNTARRQVRVVGTRFEVADDGVDDTVSVAEGLVSVCRHKGDTAKSASIPVLLDAGMRLHYTANSDTADVSQVDPATVGAWTAGSQGTGR